MEYMTTDELAQRAEISPSYARYLCRTGRVDAVKRGRDWFIAKDSADRWLQSDRKRGPKPQTAAE